MDSWKRDKQAKWMDAVKKAQYAMKGGLEEAFDEAKDMKLVVTSANKFKWHTEIRAQSWRYSGEAEVFCRKNMNMAR